MKSSTHLFLHTFVTLSFPSFFNIMTSLNAKPSRTLTPINRLKKRMETYRGIDGNRGQQYANTYLPAHNAQQFGEMKMLQRKVESTKSKKGGSKKASQAAKQNQNNSAMQQQQQQQVGALTL